MDRIPLRERIDQIRVQFAKDQFRLAKEYGKLLREAEREEDIYAIGKINLFLSVCYFHQGSRDRTLPYAYKAVSILENLDDSGLLAPQL